VNEEEAGWVVGGLGRAMGVEERATASAGTATAEEARVASAVVAVAAVMEVAATAAVPAVGPGDVMVETGVAIVAEAMAAVVMVAATVEAVTVVVMVAAAKGVAKGETAAAAHTAPSHPRKADSFPCIQMPMS
jgi:hypothetical protein